MTRKTLAVISALIIFSGLNALLIGRRLPSRRAELLEKSLIAKKSAERASRLRAWEKERQVSLTAPSLVAELASVVEDGLIPQSDSAEQVRTASLSDHQRGDLYQAISGLMQAYAKNSPKLLVQYMRSRHLRLAPGRRRSIEKVLTDINGLSQLQLEAMTDDDLYLRFWEASEIQCRQTTVLPSASRVSIWRWKDSDTGPILDATSFARLRQIPDVWLGYMMVMNNFAPVEPHTLTAQLQSKRQVLIADVELVIGHDKQSLFRKSPYMLRFWYNEGYGQWQPLMLLGTHTSGSGFPSFVDILF